MIERIWITKKGHLAYIHLRNIGTIKYRCGYIEIIPSLLFKIKLKIRKILNKTDLKVHGGITFGDLNYIPKGHETVKIGFDCLHGEDTLETCSLYFCVKECENLSKQVTKFIP